MPIPGLPRPKRPRSPGPGLGRLIAPALTALSLLVASAPAPAQTGTGLSGTPFEDALETGKARVAVAFFDKAPFASLDAEGAPRGVELEMMDLFFHQIQEEHGIEVEVEWRPFQRFRPILDAVAAGEGGVFGVSQISSTDERRERLDFSLPYMRSVGVLVTHSDVPAFETREQMIEALEERRAVTVPGTTLEGYLRELRSGPLPGLRIEEVDGAADMAAAVAADPDGTFAYMDYPQYGLALDQGFALRRHAVGDRQEDPVAVAMPKGSDWAAALDAFLDPESGFPGTVGYELLIRRHLGPGLLGAIRP